MPSIWTQNYYHAVFSTRNCNAFIDSEIEKRLYPFLAGVVRDLKSQTLAINGMPDHVHVLVRYPPDLSHSDLLRHVKGRSLKWIHETFTRLASFAWQEGSCGFTVSASQVDKVEEYIRGQKERHRLQSFEREIMKLLKLHGVNATREEVLR